MVARILNFEQSKTRLERNSAYRQALADGAPYLRRIQRTYHEARGTEAGALGQWLSMMADAAEKAGSGGTGGSVA